MKEITFRLEFDTIKRLRYTSILFMTAPKEVRLESTQDGENWEISQEWSKSPVIALILFLFSGLVAIQLVVVLDPI